MKTRSNRAAVVAMTLFLLVSLSGCAVVALFETFTPSDSTSQAANDLVTLSFSEQYRIGPGDTLTITTWDEEKLSEQITVYPDGKISFPLLGDVVAEGMTPENLGKHLEQLIESYQKGAEITVVVDNISSLEYSVLGEGVSQGVFPLTRRTTMLEAIATAGGFAQFVSRSNVILIRHVDGQEKRYRFDFDDYLENLDSPFKNIELLPGDVLLFP